MHFYVSRQQAVDFSNAIDRNGVRDDLEGIEETFDFFRYENFRKPETIRKIVNEGSERADFLCKMFARLSEDLDRTTSYYGYAAYMEPLFSEDVLCRDGLKTFIIMDGSDPKEIFDIVSKPFDVEPMYIVLLETKFLLKPKFFSKELNDSLAILDLPRLPSFKNNLEEKKKAYFRALDVMKSKKNYQPFPEMKG